MELLIVADDFTGALDTGVQFAARGAVTQVVTDLGYDLSQISQDIQVLVVDAETRHYTPEKAHDILFSIAKQAKDCKVPYFYKKTDSALRGNVGAELTAVMDAAGIDAIPFLPALPSMGRTTENGVHYIQGVPVADSVFGKDPFEPVRHSRLCEVLGEQSSKSVISDSVGVYDLTTPGIHVLDARTQDDLVNAAKGLGRENLTYCAGCAGFGTVLADFLGFNGKAASLPKLDAPLLVVCGSVNQVTINQLETAESHGFPRVQLKPEKKLEEAWLGSDDCKAVVSQILDYTKSNRCVMLDANDPKGTTETADYAKAHGLCIEDLRVRIAKTLGEVSRCLMDGGFAGTILCTGGDTLLSMMHHVGVSSLTPVGEVDSGAVLTQFTYHGREYNIISKSGGFGQPDLFVRLSADTADVK